MLSSFPLALQKKNFSVTLGVAPRAETTKFLMGGVPPFSVFGEEESLESAISIS
jgi:hypothetical protein